MTTKKCTTCKEIKDISEFTKDTSAKSGLNTQCKKCRKVVKDKWIEENKELYSRIIKNSQLKKKYGITLEEYNKMYNEQEGCCAICDKHSTESKLSLAVDHCHLTGKIRGLLCNVCNSAIGKLKDDEDLLLKAVEYLRKYKE